MPGFIVHCLTIIDVINSRWIDNRQGLNTKQIEKLESSDTIEISLSFHF